MLKVHVALVLVAVAFVAAAINCSNGSSNGVAVRVVTPTTGPAQQVTLLATITPEPTVVPSPTPEGADVGAAVEAAAEILGADAEGGCADGRDCVRQFPGDQPGGSRGLVRVVFASGQGGGALLLMGRDAAGGWGLWMAIQDEAHLLVDLPAPARACGEGEFVAIYAEPDAASAVVARVARDGVVRAESFLLTESGSLAGHGAGWYGTTAPADGWVPAFDLAAGSGCPSPEGEGETRG